VQLLGLMAVMYTIEPLLGRLYVSRSLRAAESVITQIKLEVFRVLLMQPISFYDRHSTAEITNSLAVDIETVRSAVFRCAPLVSSRVLPDCGHP
jgi:ATP-binding cassette, subfamily B (MDR/TAP), member 10